MGDDLRALPRPDAAGRGGGPLRHGDVASGLLADLSGPASLPELDAYRNWTPDAQRRALDLLRTRTRQMGEHRPFYCPNPGCDGSPHEDWLWPHARADQRPPSFQEDWLTWLLQGGRGGGKTRTGAEFTHRVTRIAPRIAVIAPTGPDGRDIMVEGESGIQATASPKNAVTWEPSKKRLTWANGAQAQVFSGEEPDRLRGPQHYFAWIDEPAHMPLIDAVWNNLLLGLRLGRSPRICATTTPMPVKWMKDTAKDPLTRVSRFSTYANIGNLADTFKRTVLNRFEGTRLGRQELHGEILEDVEGALWTWALIEYNRVEEPPPLERIVVGIDPAGSANKHSDETGIIVVGIAHGHLYVLADGSGRMMPSRWATTAMNLYDHWQADALVPEKNYGGDMVKATLRSVDSTPRILPVNSRRGKVLRAEPIVSLYEQHRVHHVGLFPELEEQQTTWVPPGDSPDRVDALVHAATNLVKNSGGVQVASPVTLQVLQGGRAG